MSSATLPTLGQSDTRYSAAAAVAETETAHSAESKEPKVTSAVDQLEQGLSQKTDAAASQGAHDVRSAKVVADGYVEQAKVITRSILSTA